MLIIPFDLLLSWECTIGTWRWHMSEDRVTLPKYVLAWCALRCISAGVLLVSGIEVLLRPFDRRPHGVLEQRGGGTWYWVKKS